MAKIERLRDVFLDAAAKQHWTPATQVELLLNILADMEPEVRDQIIKAVKSVVKFENAT